MRASGKAAPEFTGWHMLALMLCFFGIIIAVNLTMAWFARTSWTGLVVQNSYVASQHFNEKAEIGRRQAALGWTANLTLEPGRIAYALRDRQGNLVPLNAVQVDFKHPAYEAADLHVELAPGRKGGFEARAEIPDGVWIVETSAARMDGEPYLSAERLTIKGGRAQ